MSDSLKNRFIYFCSPDSEEDYFARTLIYVCENNNDGSFGIILNRSVEIRLKDFFSSANEEIEAKLNKEKIVIGGPVEPMTVYVLHNKDSIFDELISINDHISLSTDLNLIKSILEDDGPENFLVSFGYTGWSSDQLEREILSGSWLITPSDKDIIFNTPAVEKINKTSKLAGFDLTTVSSNYGNS
jgi:putative transcriptional regulator